MKGINPELEDSLGFEEVKNDVKEVEAEELAGAEGAGFGWLVNGAGDGDAG